VRPSIPVSGKRSWGIMPWVLMTRPSFGRGNSAVLQHATKTAPSSIRAEIEPMPLMTGFPPPPEGQVTLANWRTAPFNRWAFQHVREIVPSADIRREPERIWVLQSAPADLSKFSFDHDGAQLDFH